MENLINDAIYQCNNDYDTYIKSRNIRDELFISFLNDYKQSDYTIEAFGIKRDNIFDFKLERFNYNLTYYLGLNYDQYENNLFVVTSIEEINTKTNYIIRNDDDGYVILGLYVFNVKNLNNKNAYGTDFKIEF